MPYTTEWKPVESKNPEFGCIECGSKNVEYRVWEPSDEAYEDIYYVCKDCGKKWWYESSDY